MGRNPTLLRAGTGEDSDPAPRVRATIAVHDSPRSVPGLAARHRPQKSRRARRARIRGLRGPALSPSVPLRGPAPAPAPVAAGGRGPHQLPRDRARAAHDLDTEARLQHLPGEARRRDPAPPPPLRPHTLPPARAPR